MNKERTILIKNASYVYTSEREGVREGVDILIEGNQIAEVGDNLPQNVDRQIDATDKVVTPGLVNTHHHTSQAFMRHHPEIQNQPINKWIAQVGELARQMDPEAHRQAAIVNMTELMLYGCTTTTDHLYIFPEQYSDRELFEAAIHSAELLGMRFHPYRGSMSLGQFADDLVETESQIQERTQDAINSFHDNKEDSMLKVGIAPCTIFTSSQNDYENAASMATRYDVNLQTHLSESGYEQDYAHEMYGKNPLQFLQSLGWVGSRVSFAHCIKVNDADIGLLVEHDCSVCHCPISNARSPIGQFGIAPISGMLKAGVNVSLGVDGSAGSDSSNLLEEMRWARTMQGARKESTYLKPEEILYMATMGGAKTLRWEESIGSIAPGKLADIAIFDVHDSVENVGVWDKVGGLISTQSKRADTVLINGEVVVSGGHLVAHDESEIVQVAWGKWKEVFG